MYLLQNKKRTLRRAASWVMAVAIFFSCLTISPVVAKAASNGDAALQADEGDVPSENLALWLRANDGVETDGTKVTSWKNQAAVSYTHLDVYKRQLYDRLASECLCFQGIV